MATEEEIAKKREEIYRKLKNIYLQSKIEKPEEVSRTCDVCGLFFNNAKEFKKHYISHKPHECRVCKITFPDLKAYHSHYRIHSTSNDTVICFICGAKVLKTVLQGHITRMHKKNPPVKCYICDTMSNNLYSLKKHILRVHKVKPKHMNELRKMYNIVENMDVE